MAKATIDTGKFINLPTTEEFILFPEDNPGTIPLENGRLTHLRSMSPFVLKLNPPEIGNYIKNANAFGRPFRGVSTKAPAMSIRPSKETTMYKPNLASYAERPINGARLNSANQQVQDAGITDRDQIQDMMLQHRYMLELPPIVFGINPTSMAFTYQSRQSFADPTRYGFIFHRWGVDQVTIEISCTIGSFIAARERPETPDFDGNLSGISGLQYVSRRDSTAFRNLTTILAAYRNSAALVDTLGRSKAFHAVGTQSIYYDGQRWDGRITAMSYNLSEDKQHGGIEFSLSFTVFKHFQFFEYKHQLFPMTPPSTNESSADLVGEARGIARALR